MSWSDLFDMAHKHALSSGRKQKLERVRTKWGWYWHIRELEVEDLPSPEILEA